VIVEYIVTVVPECPVYCWNAAQSALPPAEPDADPVPVDEVVELDGPLAAGDAVVDLLLQPASERATHETAASAITGRRRVLTIIDVPP
jgi:hypothetical protein